MSNPIYRGTPAQSPSGGRSLPRERNKSTGKLFKHSLALYEAMEARATLTNADNQGEPLADSDYSSEVSATLVFEGHITVLMRELEIPASWYSQIRGVLFGTNADPCCIMLNAGRATEPTRVLVCRPPTPLDLTLTDEAGKLRLAEVEERVARLEAWREGIGNINLANTLYEYEQRITQLEASIAKLTGESSG
jgi:hypothetical protein